MSLANILHPNNYHVYVQNLDTAEVILVNVSDDTKIVELLANDNEVLYVGESGQKNILCGGIQFSTSQDVINYYSKLTSSEASAITVSDPNGGTITLNNNLLRMERIGNVVSVNLPVFNIANVLDANNAVHFISTAIPSRFRPAYKISNSFEYVTTANAQTSGLFTLDSSGIMTWVPHIGVNGADGVWQAAGSTQFNLNTYRATFSYVI